MFQEPLQAVELFQRLDQFLEVLQPPRRLGRLVVLPHGGIARLVQDHLGQTDVIDIGAQRFGMPTRHPFDKGAQLACRATAGLALRHHGARRLQQWQTQGARGALDVLHSLFAKTPLGRVGHPFKGQIVVGADGQPEIGHGVANLHAFIEPGAADHAIRQADGQEPVLEGAHLVAGADENRHVVKAVRLQMPGAPLQRLDLLADPARLFLAVPMADQAHLLAALLLGPQGLAQTVAVLVDQATGGGQDMGGRAVVLLQPHHRGTGKVLFKPQDIAHLGAAPAIDRLVIIAHAADVAMRLRQQAQPQVLGDIGILILVHQNVPEPPLVLLQHVRVGLEDGHDMQQKVAEIGGVQRQQSPLVSLVQLGPPVDEGRRLNRRHGGWQQRPVLPAVDQPR